MRVLLCSLVVAWACVVALAQVDDGHLEDEPLDTADIEEPLDTSDIEESVDTADIEEPLDTTDIEERGIIKPCAGFGNVCKAVPLVRCCGSAICYRSGGYSLRKPGRCVKCIAPGQKCQRDSQCCFNSVNRKMAACDKGGRLHVDGYCRPCRSSGRCYRNKQCCNKCKGWGKVFGRGTCQ